MRPLPALAPGPVPVLAPVPGRGPKAALAGLVLRGSGSGAGISGNLRAPIRVTGPQDSWGAMQAELALRGNVVVFARLADWHPADPDDPALARVLGRDWLRYLQMPHEQVRSRFLASRLLLKHAAGAALTAAPESVELAYQPGGRPYLRGCDQVDISLSHTEELLVVGLTRQGKIGVDAELRSRQLLGTGAEKQVCTPHEISLLDRMAEQRRNPAMVRLWTLKEAYSKAIGQGLRFRFTEFGFEPGAREIAVLSPDGSPGTGDEWSFGSWLVDQDYTVSVALFDAGFGAAEDIAADTMLDEGLRQALVAADRSRLRAVG